MSSRAKITWVAVVDGVSASFFDRSAQGKLTKVGSLLEADPVITNHEARRSVGSFSFGSSRHAGEHHADEYIQQCEQFAHQIIAYLDKQARQKNFDRLVLAASPRILGILRKLIEKHKQLASLIINEISKDFSNLTIDKVQKYVDKYLP